MANSTKSSNNSSLAEEEYSTQPLGFMGTLLRGFLVIIPILGLIYLLNFLYQKLHPVVEEILKDTGLDSRLLANVVLYASIFLILLIVYFVGWLAQYGRIMKFSKKMDEFLMLNIPFYRNIKMTLDNKVNIAVNNKPPVFVKFNGYMRPGFLMQDADENGNCVVFFPKNYAEMNGIVLIVNISQVSFAQAKRPDFIYGLDHLGDGLDLKTKKED